LKAFLTPANAMLSIELKNLADVLDSARQLPDVSRQAKLWSTRIHGAIWKTTVSVLIENSITGH
jgi:meiotically up-regulated gene 157 (Mug157) protein